MKNNEVEVSGGGMQLQVSAVPDNGAVRFVQDTVSAADQEAYIADGVVNRLETEIDIRQSKITALSKRLQELATSRSALVQAIAESVPLVAKYKGVAASLQELVALEQLVNVEGRLCCDTRTVDVVIGLRERSKSGTVDSYNSYASQVTLNIEQGSPLAQNLDETSVVEGERKALSSESAKLMSKLRDIPRLKQSAASNRVKRAMQKANPGMLEELDNAISSMPLLG